MTTAFVLSGGGSLGAVQAGMLQALTDNGVTPDLLIGTSAGALNAAYLAGHGTSREAVDALADIWVRLRRRDVFPFSPVRHALALAGVRESVFSSAGLRQVIASHLAYRHLEDAAIPVHVVATDLLTGREVLLSNCDAASAVLASAALPGLLPAELRRARRRCGADRAAQVHRSGPQLVKTRLPAISAEGSPVRSDPEARISTRHGLPKGNIRICRSQSGTAAITILPANGTAVPRPLPDHRLTAKVLCVITARPVSSPARQHRRFRFKSGPLPLRLGGQRSSD
jgi:hypothetical protein